MRRDTLVARNQRMGDYFAEGLRTALAGVPWVREIRGRGLLVAIEIHDGERPFRASKKVFDRSVTALLQRGTLVLGGGGYREEGGGDHLTFAPQFLTTTEELDHIKNVVADFFDDFESEVLSA
jgi:adenosylmethionine-8-amino-7-oxononanoate aminotransferase